MDLRRRESFSCKAKQDLTERGGQPLFMQPPDDPIQRDAGAYPAPLYQITGNGYGLANAPRVWYNRVLEKMTENGFSTSTHLIDASSCIDARRAAWTVH